MTADSGNGPTRDSRHWDQRARRIAWRSFDAFAAVAGGIGDTHAPVVVVVAGAVVAGAGAGVVAVVD